MKNICKLRGVGFTLATINQILGEENPDSVIGSLLEQQKKILCKEIAECQEKLIRLRKMEESIKMKRSFL